MSSDNLTDEAADLLPHPSLTPVTHIYLVAKTSSLPQVWSSPQQNRFLCGFEADIHAHGKVTDPCIYCHLNKL